ncbi:hypothetical protein ACLOJK_031352 [Asimina triloba]
MLPIRGLAPHLKSLMGPWWFSQFDPIPEVSQAARRSFEAAFPAQEKRLDALVLCTNEIFLYLDENLKLTPQALSDKATPMDELNDMHQRVISSTLLALSTLLDVLVGKQLQRPGLENAATESKHGPKAGVIAISSAEKMLSSYNYFLEFLKSQSPGVRSATYSVLGCFIKHIPDSFSNGNMKTLSAAILGAFQEKDPVCHSSMWDAILIFSRKFPDSWSVVNVQKILIPRLWNFLRHGCYGSQQVSYPVLILFLDSIPPKAIAGEQFYLNFFQNLWEGRNSVNLSGDCLALFKAFKECFLWVICNTPRYYDGRDAIVKFQASLVERILVKCLWHEYLFLASPKKSKSNLSSEERLAEIPPTKQRGSYMQDLGKCCVEILSTISIKECNLLNTFGTSFQEDCLTIFKQESLQKPTEQMVKFLSLLEKHAVKKCESWPLLYLLANALAGTLKQSGGPCGVICNPLQEKNEAEWGSDESPHEDLCIAAADSSNGIRVLSVVVAMFGARAIVSWIFSSKKDHSNSNFVHEDDDISKSSHFLENFKSHFIPWCLQNGQSSSSRIDLLLSLLDEQIFSEQWDSIVTYATSLGGGPEFSSDCVCLLAMLMENHERLNSAALSIAQCSPPFHSSHSRFLWAVLAVFTENKQSCILSRETMIHIFEEILKKLVPFLKQSSFSWARHSSSLVLSTGVGDIKEKFKSFSNIVEMGQFALEVLNGCHDRLKLLDGEYDLVPRIIAAVFFIDWECEMAPEVDGSLKDLWHETDIPSVSTSTCAAHDYSVVWSALSESLHAVHSKINANFWEGLSVQSCQKLREILIQAIRCALFEADNSLADKVPALCCKWVLDVFENLCQDCQDKQTVLDQLLVECEYWPFWVSPLVCDSRRSATLKEASTFSEIHACKHEVFILFIEKLISCLGAHMVIGGSEVPSTLIEASGKLVPSLTSYSRVWLIAEVFCTWKWQGGSALCSLMPFIRECAKAGKPSAEKNLIYSATNILLDGALINGESAKMNFCSVWAATDTEIEKIRDPFLRALMSLLSTLVIKDDIWMKDEAFTFLEHVLNKLFIGTMVNRSCLKILPFILNVLIQPLRSESIRAGEDKNSTVHDSLQEDRIRDSILGWLQMALSAPPLAAWQMGEHDFEDWVHVVISCFPLNISGGKATLTMALSKNVSQSEKSLLLNLFQKHRLDINVSSVQKTPLSALLNVAGPSSVSVQLMLSKLMAVSVAYCWHEFNENDWDFVLYLSYGWIESAVVAMEEIAENVDIIMNSSADDVEDIIEKLEKAVQALDPSVMDTARISLFIFSLFCGIPELKLEDDANRSQPLEWNKWDHVKHQIFEGVLRLFFATGITEAIASSYHEEAATIVASTRLAHSHFWELVALSVINSPESIRNTAVKSVELWALSKGSISSLYAILFSPIPIPRLQVAAYIILSTEPVWHRAVSKDSATHLLDGNPVNYQDMDTSDQIESSSEVPIHLREEISCMIEKQQYSILEVDLLVQQRHIPLKVGSVHNLKKQDADLPAEASKAAAAAKLSISTNSLLFSVELLWPVGTEQMASLAGSIYGLMLCLLPAYLRNWFTGLRDHSLSSAIESFTKAWCSPHLLADEFSRIKEVVVADENFSVSVNRSSFEVTATYKKEETGMDLVIRLPSCYPLRPVDVDCTRSLGISEVKQRKWLLSMTAFVRNQNGAIAEAIRIWKSNFDKEFQGVEECPICYSFIHTANHSLPRLACKTCKHKFHSACLYKWFSTSHKSTCPLCQTPF